jgi:hypothetical protein
MSFGSGGLTLDIPLPTGQYRVLAEIRNNDNHEAYINEVAYIYSNLTTDLDRVMATTDFSDMTTISGTVRYMENGVDLGDYRLSVYTSPNGFSSLEASAGSFTGGGAEPYTLRIPRPDKNITLYFIINKDYNRWPAGSITLNAEQVSATKDISLNRSVITLSGPLAVTVDGNTPDIITVGAYSYEEGKGSFNFESIASGGSWSISGIPSDFSGTVNFSIRAYSHGEWYTADAGSWTSGSPTSGISLSASFIFLSGSIGTVTVNGTMPDSVRIYARTSDYSYYWGYMDMDTGNWQIQLPGEVSGTLTIWIDVEYAGGLYSKDLTTRLISGSSLTGIALGNVDIDLITLSGSIGTITVNGTTPSFVDVYAITPDYSSFYSGSVNGGNWQIGGIPGDFSGTLIIGVMAEYAGGLYSKDLTTQTISGSSLTGIALGNVAITLSPISGTVTTNGSTPLNSGWVDVFDPSKMPDLDSSYSQLLGSVEIINGAFSGYVNSGFTTGYVGIYDFTDDSYYITPSPVNIGSSMSFNLTNMTKRPDLVN